MRAHRMVQAAFWVTAAAAFGADTGRGSVTVRVLNYAEVPKGILRDAVRGAGEVYRAAGIRLEWMACTVSANKPEPCPAPEGAQLQVKIMPDAPPGSAVARHPYARAEQPVDGAPGFLVHVYYGDVKEGARSADCEVETLLAAVMVHEIAHLLGLPHSTGVMKPTFDWKDMRRAAAGSLRFEEAEVKRMRIAVASIR
jgi:hypothetical protein